MFSLVSTLIHQWQIQIENKNQKQHNCLCTKCATACSKPIQHKLDQFFASCHEHSQSWLRAAPATTAAAAACFRLLLFNCVTTKLASADPPDCQESSLSQLGPTRNIKYMFRHTRDDVAIDASVFSLNSWHQSYKDKAPSSDCAAHQRPNMTPTVAPSFSHTVCIQVNRPWANTERPRLWEQRQTSMHADSTSSETAERALCPSCWTPKNMSVMALCLQVQRATRLNCCNCLSLGKHALVQP